MIFWVCVRRYLSDLVKSVEYWSGSWIMVTPRDE